ncbi:ankyrin-1-like [Macrosteles quadrilineatus]|uniref:ankyrin-1-like n=1 Tax=Macrosteles quadrilineatus TaxID=74068 RepID=UPI0023E1D90C|nr:ankyrin-1-like [Macrosteles quadrilineatus]
MRADSKGKIPLLLAVEAGNQSMCRELLSQQTADQLKATTDNGDTALHLAARRRDVDMVRILVDYGANVDSQNSEGQTALHIASAEGDETLVKYFYGVRASASIIDNQDRTPMHLAAENGHASIIELLADKFKASIFERTKDGSTLMHIASLNGHADCAMMLFKKGVYLHMPNKNGARSIHTAARYGHVGIINTLLQKGEKVDVTTSDNYTPLHIAVESCKPAVVETLLGYGADVHIRGGKNKETPLHIASRVKDGEKCGLMLLKSGAGPNLATEDGQTPVHVAASNGNLATLLLLLEDGGDPMFKSKKGETPLHLACANCHADIAKHLLDFVKANNSTEVSTGFANTVNEDGASALHYAGQVTKAEIAHRENPLEDKEVVRLLLEAGGDVNIQTHKMMESAFHYIAVTGNNDTLLEMLAHMSSTEAQKALNRQNVMGWTPLLIACHHGHTDMVNTLLANHARVDVFDIEGRSALHLAAEQGYQQVCDALLTNKAFINSKSRVGRTALHLAAMKGFANLCKFLIQDHNAMIDVLTLRKQTPLHLAAAAGQLEVCRLLLELGASIDATDDQGQKPIHVAAQNNFPEVAQLFLQQHPSLVMASTKDGNTCAHIAAMQGSVRVIEELMKFDRTGVISARNRVTEATPLQLAAEGGHADVVKVLVRAGASCTDENKAGFTAVHLAAQNGHGQSDPPTGASLVGELGNESGMTPLHFAAYSGNENVVRLLLNSVGVQVDAATSENGYNPLHLACFGGHITVVGLLLSRSSDLLHSSDKHGKTGLHVAATHGHYQMVEVLLGQGAEINATDKNGWTALHCAARAGCFDVVRLLVESGASPKSETNYGSAPIWFAASEGHNDVLEYLLTKEHDTYNLMEDRRFVYNLMVCSKKHNDKPMQEFILVSPAPVDTAAKLSAIYIQLSSKEKERAKDLISAGQFCEGMATELLALAAGADSAGRILTATDRRNMEFLDVLIENEQKEVIAHTVVQRYLQELWQGSLGWAAWKTMLLFITFIICPPILDFLSFHYLFGPWAIIIGNLMKDLARFLAVLAIFIFGFAMHIVALNQPFKNQTPEEIRAGQHNHKYVPPTYGYFAEVRLNPMSALEFLFFAVFGQTTPDNLKTKDTTQPEWTLYLFKFVFGIYMLVSVVVLINLLIAMMSDTYQRIQAQSDIEWKYGLAKLIRNMHRTTTTPSPINLITTWLMYLLRICKRRMMQRKRPSLVQMMGLQSRSRVSARSKMGAKWLAKVKKGQVAPKESVALSVVHLSPLGSQLSFSNAATRIENIIDWEMIANKYRALIGELNESNQSGGDNGEPANASGDSTAPAMTNQS